MLIVCCVSLIGCAANNPPIAIKGIDFDDWQGHTGGICLSQAYAKSYLHWENHK